jgi:ketosteroid isomerase-like protein
MLQTIAAAVVSKKLSRRCVRALLDETVSGLIHSKEGAMALRNIDWAEASTPRSAFKPVTALLGFLLLGYLAPGAAKPATAETVEQLIQRQSREFSDASASGDAAVLNRYLDEHVVFMNEDGSIASKKDIVDGASAPAKGVSNSLKQNDWGFELHGNVAVTRFTDELSEDYHGQPFHEKFRSTEVWLNEQGSWRMISSQTMALQEDPPAVTVADEVLDQYVGTYQAGPDVTYRIARSGHELTGAVGNNAPVAMQVEVQDVLFTPGQPRLRKIMQRDAQGKVTGFVSRREGHDLSFRRIS